MRLLLLAVWIMAAGCAEPCIRHSDCVSQLVCQVGVCVMPAIDGDVADGDTFALDGSTDGMASDGGVDAPPADGSISDAGADTADAFVSVLDGASFTDVIALDSSLIDVSMGADGGAPDAAPDAVTTMLDGGDDT